MTFLYLYAIFAMATAINSMFEIVHPVIKLESQIEKVEAKGLLYMIAFCLALLAAPLVFLACVVPHIGDSFRKGFREGVFPKI